MTSSDVITGTEQELADRLRVAVMRLQRRLRQHSVEGLSPAQVSLLGSVQRLGFPTLGELASEEQVQPPTMTRLVAGLEGAGLLERSPDLADGRVSQGAPQRRRCGDPPAYPLDQDRLPDPAAGQPLAGRASRPRLRQLHPAAPHGGTVTRLRLAAGKTFRALEVRNYRLYFFGQVVSVSGTWMQSVALGWLVLRLTGSGIDLGLVTALQFLPMLLLGSWGGLVADRVDKRRVLFCTQSFAAALALVLGLLDR